MIEAPIESPVALVAVITAVTALAFWLDRHVAGLAKLGASLLAIVFGALLSNLGLIADSSPVYGVVTGPVTLLAIVWLLLAVDLSDVRKAGPRMLSAFGLAVLGTALGAIVGALIFGGRFGEDTWRLAGTLTGTFSGGSVNFLSVGTAVGLSELLFAGTTAADNAITALWLGATLVLPIWLKPFYPTPIPGPAEHEDVEVKHPFFHKEPISTLDLSVLLASGLALVIASGWLASVVPLVPGVVWLTTLALLAGHLTPLRRASGAFELGNLTLHFFFVVIGIYSQIDRILEVGIAIFFFTLTVVLVHGVFVYGVGRMLRFDVGTLSVASQAAVGGPSSALAVAVSREWRGLLLPGVIVGLLGYAVGTYLGLGLASVVRLLGIGL